MISQTAEYALRAAVHLATHTDRPHTAEEISGPTQVPADYLAKVLRALVRHGIVLSQRGRNGGFALARPAREITILDVINAVDPVKRIDGCPLHLPEHADHLCPLHKRLDDAAAAVEKAFARSRLSEMTDRKRERS